MSVRFSSFLAVVLASAAAADPPKTALDYVPETCEQFGMIAGVRERVEWIERSGVVQNFLALKEIREAVDAAKKDADLKKALAELSKPEVLEVWNLVKELGSEEVSVALDRGWAKLQNDLNEARLQVYFSAFSTALTSSKVTPIDLMNDVLARYPDLQVPGMLVSFKSNIGDRLERRLASLQKLKEEKKIPGGLTFGKPGDPIRCAWRASGKDFRLTNEMVAGWGDDANLQPRPEAAEGVRKWLEARTLVVAVANVDGRWILSIGADDSFLKQWGKAPSLSASKVFAPVRALNRRDPIWAASYSSLEAAKLGRFDLEGTIAQFRPLTLIARPFAPAGLIDRVMSDLSELAKDIAAVQGPPSESIDVEYATTDGFESIAFSHAPGHGVDYDRPIAVLRHAPADAAVAVAASSKSSLPSWRRGAFWVKRLYAYWREYGRKTIDEDDRERAAELEKLAVDFGRKLNEVMEEKILPSVDEAQSLTVIDLRARSEVPGLKGAKAIVPEFAVAMTIRDKRQLVAGVREVVELIHETLNGIRKVDENVPAAVADFRIPSPIAEAAQGGERFSYPQWDVAGVLTPHILLRDDLLVLSSSRQLTDRMLASKSVADPQRVGLSEASGRVIVIDWKPFVAAGVDWCRVVAASSPETSSVGTVGPVVLQLFGLLDRTTTRTLRRDGLYETRTFIRLAPRAAAK